jgi:hypothetical protein
MDRVLRFPEVKRLTGGTTVGAPRANISPVHSNELANVFRQSLFTLPFLWSSVALVFNCVRMRATRVGT